MCVYLRVIPPNYTNRSAIYRRTASENQRSRPHPERYGEIFLLARWYEGELPQQRGACVHDERLRRRRRRRRRRRLRSEARFYPGYFETNTVSFLFTEQWMSLICYRVPQPASSHPSCRGALTRFLPPEDPPAAETAAGR